MMLKILKRAKFLLRTGEALFSSPILSGFLEKDMEQEEFMISKDLFHSYMDLDDSDIWSAIKIWSRHPDYILSTLSRSLINRNLYHIEWGEEGFDESRVFHLKDKAIKELEITDEDLDYFVFTGKTHHLAYNLNHENIVLLKKENIPISFLQVSDFFSSTGIAIPVEKRYMCHYRF